MCIMLEKRKNNLKDVYKYKIFHHLFFISDDYAADFCSNL